jgi:hypothetical protein
VIVTFGIAKLANGKIRLIAERPQHSAKAERIYPSVDDVRRVLSDMGIPSDTSDFHFKLLPDLDPNQTVKLPPLYVAEHLLAQEKLNLEA